MRFNSGKMFIGDSMCHEIIKVFISAGMWKDETCKIRPLSTTTEST